MSGEIAVSHHENCHNEELILKLYTNKFVFDQMFVVVSSKNPEDSPHVYSINKLKTMQRLCVLQ